MKKPFNFSQAEFCSQYFGLLWVKGNFGFFKDRFKALFYGQKNWNDDKNNRFASNSEDILSQ